MIFSKTKGFHHKSIPVGIKAIQKLGLENKFDIDMSTDASVFSSAKLRKYKAVVFLSPTGNNLLNEDQRAAFRRYIQSGGAFVGIHAATDCEFEWQWYGNLVGAYFGGHPAQQEAVLKVEDSGHASTRHLPKEWRRKDEWYNFKWMSPDIRVLIAIDENTYDAGSTKMGAQHPVAWYHEFEGGRSFYTALGHTDESYSDPLFLKHLLGGLEYALGRD